ncbi:hypothetical protein M1L60_00415 [Actinoplanes sp. TRM 88003]|uniref:Uncharacterized protein n=1 Tax=Paractinoplanes aksuensis TaxID=2939490 RepID=A0ABT1DG53_9ACTN|nr:hypothetical protein [Actinoplanes aksuensis]MCO8269046.1 hypothetical protein [Actinoplanes aksuensis]
MPEPTSPVPTAPAARRWLSGLLLAAFPARLRRKHGSELIVTMVELAGPGGRPTTGDRARLVLDGLWERFRPPTKRPFAVLAAVLALLVGGALGAAGGSWLGTFGYATLPDAAALGQRALPQVEHASGSGNYLYAQGPLVPGADLEQIRQRLAADSWQTRPIKNGHFLAESEGVQVDVHIYPDVNLIDLAGWPARPGSYVPLTLTGLLLGLAGGWLVGVALAHRVHTARKPGRSIALATTGLVLIIPSAVGFVASLVRYLTVAEPLGTGELVHFHGFAFGPTIDLLRAYDMGEGWYLTPSDFQQLPLYGFVLIAVAAVLARPRREFEAVA